MKNKDILKAVKNIEFSLRESESMLNNLIASLGEKEVEELLPRCKTISKSKVQREFHMGYSSASRLVDNLLERGLIERKGDSFEFNIVKSKK